MATPKPWRFEQLGGDRKVLILDGYSAPFGRPRKAPVVTKKLKIRQKVTRYPGNSATVTRHIFGDAYEPWKLSGRWMDREKGTGYALSKAREVETFVQDKQEVRISWGDILSFTGFLTDLETELESDAEIAWTLDIDIDLNDEALPESTFTAAPSPPSMWNQIKLQLGHLDDLSKFPDLKPSFLDSLSSLISSINSITGSLSHIVSQMQSFEQALAGDLQRLRAGLGQLRTAVLQLRNLAFTTQQDAISIRRSFGTDSRTGGLFADFDLQSMYACASIQDMDRQAAIAQRGKVRTSYVAKGGDTWESISANAYGSTANADLLRGANGVRYGEKPQPGRKYQIPHPS